MNGGNSREHESTNCESENFREMDSTYAAMSDHAVMQHGDPAGRCAFAESRDHGMDKTGDARQKKWPGEGEGRALMLEIAFPDGLRMGEKEPGEHGQVPVGHRE